MNSRLCAQMVPKSLNGCCSAPWLMQEKLDQMGHMVIISTLPGPAGLGEKLMHLGNFVRNVTGHL